MKKPFIYLASKSPRRAELLKEMELDFELVKSNYDEKAIDGISARDLAMTHSRGKAAHAVIAEPNKHPLPAYILGADTVVVFEKKSLGKPRDFEQAENWLMQMSGKTNTVISALTLIDVNDGYEETELVETKVTFKKWAHAEIQKYVRDINALDKAGAYAIQSEPCIVEKYEGSYSNVIGLPKEALTRLIEKLNARQ